MNERERLIKILEKASVQSWDDISSLADYLIEVGVVALPVAVGSPCKIRKLITNRKGKLKKIEVENAVVREVCVLTESKSGKQLMSLINVIPDSDE